ncbi:MAG: ABC transporter substrate-binding protein [Desulfobulbaceae bacterium]|nr:MAG: ABC transporter substrate-binding protein [Desulfobulbaceae bacterium]
MTQTTHSVSHAMQSLKRCYRYPAASDFAKIILLGCLLFCGVLSSPSQGRAQGHDKIEVFTSLAPVAFVVAQIGGEQIRSRTLLPPGRDPHTYSPTPRQMAVLSKAHIYFTVGMPFERELLPRLSGRRNDLQVVDCSSGLAKRALNHDDHSHHHDQETDPHIWLGIQPLAGMAENIAATLSRRRPEQSQLFADNLAGFLARLRQVEQELKHTLAPFQGRGFLVFHPSFGYFADSFGLVQHAVEIEGKSPSPRQLTRIIKLARAEGIKVIFVQPQFDRRAASRIAQAIGGRIVTLDPLAADPFANFREMATKIAAALTPAEK